MEWLYTIIGFCWYCLLMMRKSLAEKRAIRCFNNKVKYLASYSFLSYLAYYA